MHNAKSMFTHCAPHNPTKRVPGSVIKPVEKVVEPMVHHIMCGSVVKPEIDSVKIMAQFNLWYCKNYLQCIALGCLIKVVAKSAENTKVQFACAKNTRV